MPTNKIVWTWKMYDELTSEQKVYVCNQRHVDITDTSGPFGDRPLWVFIESLFLIDELGEVQKIDDVSAFERWKQRLEDRDDLTAKDRDELIKLRSQKAETVIKLLLKGGEQKDLSGWSLFPEMPDPARRTAARRMCEDFMDRFNSTKFPTEVCMSAASLMLYRFNFKTGDLVERKVPSPEELTTALRERGLIDVQVRAILFERERIAEKLGWDSSKS